MFTLFALVLAQAFTAQGPFAIAPSSRLWIEGESNFKSWSCEAREASASADPFGSSLVPVLELQVPIKSFHCNEDPLDGKLREALKADRFPSIGFSMESAERLPGKALRVRITGSLSLAGQTGTVSFIAEVTSAAQGAFVARGNIPLLMSSYDVEPPSALLGLIKASDRVVVRFEVRVTPAARVSL